MGDTGFPKMGGYPKMDGLEWESYINMDDLGLSRFSRKLPSIGALSLYELDESYHRI